jgi:hypothetical protein
MVELLVVGVVALVGGFAAGRVKNASKLAELKAELAKLEAFGKLEEQKVVAAVKSLLSKVGL